MKMLKNLSAAKLNFAIRRIAAPMGAHLRASPGSGTPPPARRRERGRRCASPAQRRTLAALRESLISVDVAMEGARREVCGNLEPRVIGGRDGGVARAPVSATL